MFGLCIRKSVLILFFICCCMCWVKLGMNWRLRSSGVLRLVLMICLVVLIVFCRVLVVSVWCN